MYPFIRFMVGLMDGLDIKTLVGTMSNHLVDDEPAEKKPKYYREKLTKVSVKRLDKTLPT